MISSFCVSLHNAEEVALKLIKPEIVSDESTPERFNNELRCARKLTHKNPARSTKRKATQPKPYRITRNSSIFGRMLTPAFLRSRMGGRGWLDWRVGEIRRATALPLSFCHFHSRLDLACRSFYFST